MSYLVYVITSVANDVFSRAEGKISNSPYTRAAVSADGELEKIYAFERRKNGALITGGPAVFPLRRYVAEGDLPIRIFALPVSDEDYEIISSRLTNIEKNKDKYIYNAFEAVTGAVNIPCRVPYAYTGVGFVSRLLSLGRVRSVKGLEFILSDYLIFEGRALEIVPDAEIEPNALMSFTFDTAIDGARALGELALRKLDDVFEKEGIYELLQNI